MKTEPELQAFNITTSRGETLAVHADYAEHLTAEAFTNEEVGRLFNIGRGFTRELSLPTSALIIRQYYRGGLIAKLSKNRYVYTGLKKTRPWKEAVLTEYLRIRGLPVPTIAGFFIKRQSTSYTASIASLKIPQTETLWDKIERRDTIDWQSIGHTIARCHHVGANHADLNARNILIDAENKVWIIDWDKSSIRTSSTSYREANLLRLKRSLIKVFGDEPSTENAWKALHKGYKDTI